MRKIFNFIFQIVPSLNWVLHDHWFIFHFVPSSKFNIKPRCYQNLISAHFGYTSTMDQSMGLLTPLSFVPHSSLPYSDDMTLSQRFYNTFITAYDVVFRRLNYIRAQNKLAQKHFKAGIEGEIPHVLKMEREISVMLVNSHNSLNKPRPKMPGLIDIGGAHIKTNVHLPVDTVTVSFVQSLKLILKRTGKWNCQSFILRERTQFT